MLLIGNIIYVGLVTIAQKRLDWMLGYSSVMHMGYIFLGIASANVIGMNGAALLMFAHGISIALLFALAGEIRAPHRHAGILAISAVSPKAMPFAGFAFGVATFAAIGLPGFANFAAEVMVFFGAFRVGADLQGLHFFQVTTVLALWGVVISAVYMLRAYRAIFMGAPNERWSALPDLKLSLRIPVAPAHRGHACDRVLPEHGAARSAADFLPRAHPGCPMIPTPALEIAVLVWGLVLLLAEAFAGKADKRVFAIAGIIGLAAVLVASFFLAPAPPLAPSGFWSFYTADPLAIFFKRFALVTTIFVLVMAIDYAPSIRMGVPGEHPHAGLGEFFALPIFTCAGLMWMASAIDFVMIFVSLELVTMSFYVLVAFHPAPAGDARGGREIFDPERALDRVFGLRDHLDFRRDRRDQSRADRRGALVRQLRSHPAALRHRARARGARVQDRRGAVPDLGAGCLSRRADSGDGFSFRRLEGCRLRRVAARSRAVFDSAGSRQAARRHGRAHAALRKSRRAPADEPEAAARLFEHRARRIFADRRGLLFRRGGFVLSRRLSAHDAA